MFLYDVSNFDSFSRCSLVFLTEQQEHNTERLWLQRVPRLKTLAALLIVLALRAVPVLVESVPSFLPEARPNAD